MLSDVEELDSRTTLTSRTDTRVSAAEGFRLASVLWPHPEVSGRAEAATAPEFFTDLSLMPVIAAITSGREEYNLAPFFHVPLQTVAAVQYRQAVFKDLESRSIRAPITAFGDSMRGMRGMLEQTQKAYYTPQKQRWFLEAADAYCAAVIRLERDMRQAALRSDGLKALRAFLSAYVSAPAFVALLLEARELKAALAQVRYRLHLEGPRVTVSRYEAAPDYGDQVMRTFEKFRQGNPKDYEFDLPYESRMNPVEAAVLARVALLFPEEFNALARFCEVRSNYLDPILQRFDREVQFYLATLDFFETQRRAGLPYCFPLVSESKQIDCREVFDLSLALQLKSDATRIVRNDFYLHGAERILVVSGANQGGKTTFARTVGQLHYLASLGCPVAAREARLFLVDQILTHFERQESLRTLRSKLEDDLVRIHRMLGSATGRSLLIMNESFSSATLNDALFLGREVMRRVMQRDLICVFVTFLDELSTLGAETVSLVSTVEEGEVSQRTFRIVRMRANGLAYAAAIARKYRLTFREVKERLRS